MQNTLISTEVISSAYLILYDFVALRTHPIANYLIHNTEIPLKERGWQIHNLLLDAVHQLDPGPDAPVFSKEWRRHRLMVLRYVDGLDPQAVAENLAISRRQYYREHNSAVEAVATILNGQTAAESPVASHEDKEKVNLLQSEFNRLSQHEQHAQLTEVVEGISELLHEIIKERNHALQTAIPSTLPGLQVSGLVLRQVLLSLLGMIVTHYQQVTMYLNASHRGEWVEILLRTDLEEENVADLLDQQLSPYRDTLTSNRITMKVVETGPHFEILLRVPHLAQKSILVIDDNQDVLKLYEHYLVPHNYTVFFASNAESALDMVQKIQPSLIIIDLMMPQMDGWELLKHLKRGETAISQIPVIICSVLKQRELAIAMGAQQFIEKPITEQRLLHAVESLLR